MSGQEEPWHESDPRLEPGLALLRTRQFYSALQYFSRCVALGGGGAARFHLGVAQHGLGQLKAAAASFHHAAMAGFRGADARCALATVLAEDGDTKQAESQLRTAIDDDPRHGGALANLAILLERRGAVEEALVHYDRAIEVEPAVSKQDHAHLQTSRTRALFALHRDADALEATDRALAADPGSARAWLDRILALSSLHRLAEAREAVEQAFAFAGEAVLALENGPRSRAQLDPTILYIDRALHRQDVCAWQDRAQLVKSIRALLADEGGRKLADPGMLFRMLALPLSGRELKAVGLSVAQSAPIQVPPFLPRVRQGERIRVGFVSPEFRPHPAAWLLRRLFADRDRGRFEFFAYALNPEDGSEVRSEFARSADAFLDVSSWNPTDIVSRLRADALDLLIDNSGYFAGTRPQIVQARAAPVQAGWMGIACTLGPGMLDYRISDAIATPLESQEDWYERLALIPAPHAAYDTDQPMGDPGSRASHVLPEGDFVFCCFNQALKIDPEIFAVWLQLLRQVPKSVLWLLDNGPLARHNLIEAAREGGVPARRLVFAPRVGIAEHLGRMRHADLFLDTLHYGAHTTAADALHAGVPVLTRLGSTMASRIAGAFVRTAGIPELVVDSLEGYQRMAIELAEQPTAILELRTRLARARAHEPFFSTVQRVRAVERAFSAIVSRSRAGLPPDTLIIE